VLGGLAGGGSGRRGVLTVAVAMAGGGACARAGRDRGFLLLAGECTGMSGMLPRCPVR
jgi:hypothetical protein